MKLHIKIALITGAFALSACSVAFAGQPEGVPPDQSTAGVQYTPAEPPPGPKAGLPEQAKAYGRRCKEEGFQKVHTEGEPGTAFSRCVKAAAQAAKGVNPRKACANTSKKHVKGVKGTEFSRCVKVAAQVRREQHVGIASQSAA